MEIFVCRDMSYFWELLNLDYLKEILCQNILHKFLFFFFNYLNIANLIQIKIYNNGILIYMCYY